MAANSEVRKLASETNTHATLAAQQQLMSLREDGKSYSAVAGGESNQSFMQKVIPKKDKSGTQEIRQDVQNSLPNSPMSSLEASYNDISGSARHTSSTVNSNPTTTRREQATVQGVAIATAKAIPATTRREQTTVQGSERATAKAIPTAMRREQTTVQGSERATSKAIPAAVRREQATVQGSERATAKAIPAAVRREQTTVQGGGTTTVDSSPTKREQTTVQGGGTTTVDSSPTKREQTTVQGGGTTTVDSSPTRKEQTTVQGNERATSKPSPATMRREQTIVQGGERATAKPSPAIMRREQSMHLSSEKAVTDPAKSTAPAKPARSSKAQSNQDRAMQRDRPEPYMGTWVSPKTEHKHIPEHAVNKETAAKLLPPTHPSAKLKPRPPPFTLPESSQTEPEDQGVEAFSVAADLESPPESPKAKPDNVIARQLSEQADEEEIFYSRQESLGANTPQDAYTAELLADPKLRQLHDMFPGEQVSHLQKLLEENKGEVEKAVAVLFGETTNPSQSQSPGMPIDEDVYDDDHSMGKYAMDAPVSSTVVDSYAISHSRTGQL